MRRFALTGIVLAVPLGDKRSDVIPAKARIQLRGHDATAPAEERAIISADRLISMLCEEENFLGDFLRRGAAFPAIMLVPQSSIYSETISKILHDNTWNMR
jgi:hypothetical protein